MTPLERAVDREAAAKNPLLNGLTCHYRPKEPVMVEIPARNLDRDEIAAFAHKIVRDSCFYCCHVTPGRKEVCYELADAIIAHLLSTEVAA